MIVACPCKQYEQPPQGRKKYWVRSNHWTQGVYIQGTSSIHNLVQIWGNKMVWEMNLKIISNMNFRDAMNLLYVPWNYCWWWSFNFCIQHLEDMLEQCIIDDCKWLMAFEYPARDEIPKFSFVVCRSLCIVSNALQRVHNLALTSLDMADKVCFQILFVFMSK